MLLYSSCVFLIFRWFQASLKESVRQSVSLLNNLSCLSPKSANLTPKSANLSPNLANLSPNSANLSPNSANINPQPPNQSFSLVNQGIVSWSLLVHDEHMKPKVAAYYFWRHQHICAFTFLLACASYLLRTTRPTDGRTNPLIEMRGHWTHLKMNEDEVILLILNRKPRIIQKHCSLQRF